MAPAVELRSRPRLGLGERPARRSFSAARQRCQRTGHCAWMAPDILGVGLHACKRNAALAGGVGRVI
eukprot:5867796-Lingulodinium_polyedra.AAC.1